MSKTVEFLFVLVLVCLSWLFELSKESGISIVCGTLAGVILVHTYIRLLGDEF